LLEAGDLALDPSKRDSAVNASDELENVIRDAVCQPLNFFARTHGNLHTFERVDLILSD
jgi:hypothetical protein